MSYHEGSNWQARKEDAGKPLYDNKPKKQIESPLDALRTIDLMFDQIGEGYTIKQIAEYVRKTLGNHQPPSAQQPVDAVATANNPHWLYTQWCEIWEQAHNNNRSDFQKLMRKNYALFSGSQAGNQSEERELWQEVAMIIYEHDGKLVATIDRLKERFHITPKTQQHD